MAAIDLKLEADYNIVAARGSLDAVMQRWSAASATLRSNADASLDCCYGDTERERIDVFRCGMRNAPLYVYLHGGYWQRGDKKIYSFIAEPFLNAGIDVALVGYPLCPQVSMTALANSVRNSIAWLYQHAESLGVNRDRINLSGHSAGGQLTALGVCTDWTMTAEDLPKNLLKTAIPFSGLYDLEPLLQTSINDALQLTEDEVDELSPAKLQPATALPLLVILGGAETAEFFHQADALTAAWAEHLPLIDRHVEADVDHIDLIDRLASADSEVFQRIFNWLQ